MPTRDTANDEGSYYPSAKVRLILRFDELGRRVFNTPNNPVPPKPTRWLSGVRDSRAPLRVQLDPDAPEGVRRYQLFAGPNKSFLFSGTQSNRVVSEGGVEADGTGIRVGNSDRRKYEHLVVGRSADGLTHVLAGIVPKEAQWNQNGVRTADTLSLTIRYIDCPIDPRTLRSCAVEFFLGTVTPEEFRAGAAGESREVRLYSGASFAEPMHVVPDSTVRRGVTYSNRRFIGWVDKWSMDWSDAGEPLIRIECRDNTQLLIDQEAPPKLLISGARGASGTQRSGGVPIDEAVATYLSHFPQFAGLTVEYRPQGEVVPSLADTLAKTAFRPQLGPPPSAAAGSNSGLSVWDYLTDVCGALGLSVRVEDTTVVIQRTRSIYSDDTRPVQRSNDPFVPRFDGQQYRRFLYGENLVSMKMDRNFTRNAPTNIEVRCYSTKQKRVLVGRFPTRLVGQGIQSSLPGDGGAEEKWLVWRVSGVENAQTLRVIAQTIYEMLGRAELSVHVETRNLASLGGGNSDSDLLDMRAGDTFELLVRRNDPDEGNEITRIDSALVAIENGAAFMRALGFDDDFAQTYARTYVDIGLQSTFKCRNMTIGWDCDSGVSVKVEGVNYIEVRADPIKAGLLPQDERQQ